MVRHRCPLVERHTGLADSAVGRLGGRLFQMWTAARPGRDTSPGIWTELREEPPRMSYAFRRIPPKHRLRASFGCSRAFRRNTVTSRPKPDALRTLATEAALQPAAATGGLLTPSRAPGDPRAPLRAMHRGSRPRGRSRLHRTSAAVGPP